MKKRHSETLFTFVLDWKGGTYLSQVRASTLKIARIKWLNSINLEIFGTHQMVSDLVAEMEEGDTVLLKGLESAWCFGFRIDDTLAIVHVIATCQSNPAR